MLFSSGLLWLGAAALRFFAGNTLHAGAQLAAGLLGIIGALLLGRTLGEAASRRRPHLAAALFAFCCLLPSISAGANDSPALLGLAFLPPLMLLWSGTPAALLWSLLVAVLMGASMALKRSGLVPTGVPVQAEESLFYRLGLLASMLYTMVHVVRVLQERADAFVAQGQQLNEKTVELQKQITRANEDRDAALEGAMLKGRFLATMSHELRTPLNAVIGMASLLKDSQLTEEQIEYVTTIEGGSQALLMLIGDILDLSKIEAGKIEPENVEIDLAHLIEQSMGLVSVQAFGKGVELIYAPAPQTPATLRSDPARLQQILVNLLSNAVKFTDKGEVVLSVRPGDEPETLLFSVKDTGIGIPESKLAKLFQPFTQIDGATRGGTGLGLVISSALVELLGGKISVESKTGAGSTFSFSVASGCPGQPPVVVKLPPQLPSALLVCDANLTSRDVLLSYLKAHGTHASNFTTPSSLIERLESSSPRVLLLDPREPGVPPMNLLTRLATMSDLPPIVLMYPKGASDRAQIEAFFFASFKNGSQIVSKPLRQSAILSAISAALAGEQQDRSAVQRNEARKSSALRVLVAEDNEVNQRVIAKMVQKAGGVATVVSNGKLAVEALRVASFDCVIMDVNMPVMDGLEATRQIVASIPRPRRPRIIGLTANALAGDREACMAAGMDDYLTKPIQFDALRKLIGAPAASPAAPEKTPETDLSERSFGDVIDPHVATELRTRLNTLKLQEITNELSELSAEPLAQLLRAVDEGDTDTIVSLASKLRQFVAPLGLVRLYALLVKVEQDARDHNAPSLARYSARLTREFERARTALLRLASSMQTSVTRLGDLSSKIDRPPSERHLKAAD